MKKILKIAFKYILASIIIFAILYGGYYAAPRLFTMQYDVHEHDLCIHNSGDKTIVLMQLRDGNNILYKIPETKIKVGDSNCYDFESAIILSSPLLLNIQIEKQNYEKRIDLSRYDIGSIEIKLTLGPGGEMQETNVRNTYGDTSYAGMPYHKVFLLLAIICGVIGLCIIIFIFCMDWLILILRKR